MKTAIVKPTTNLESVLKDFLPANSIDLACKMLRLTPCNIKITESRNSVQGDFRVDPRSHKHTITINGDLNKYSFLVTLMHELAHLNTWVKYNDKVKPHGEEWKNEFRRTLGPFQALEIFPADLRAVVSTYLKDPSAATCSDPRLTRALAKFDRKKPDELLLEELPDRARFMYNRDREFIKGKKVRTRFECHCATSNHIYLFHPLAKVSKV